jgi:N-acetylmuramoyl-L-alanine amidase
MKRASAALLMAATMLATLPGAPALAAGQMTPAQTAEGVAAASVVATAAAVTDSTKAVTARWQTSIRLGRSTEYDEVAPVAPGERLTFLETTEGWVRVRNSSGASGWVSGNDVRLSDPAVAFPFQPEYHMEEGFWRASLYPTRAVGWWISSLPIRTAASATAPIRAWATTRQQLKLLWIPSGEYVPVLTESGIFGWVSRYSLMMAPTLPRTEEVYLQETGPNQLRLEVRGPKGAISAQGNVLHVDLPYEPNRKGSLPVGTDGINRVNFDPNGVTVYFAGSFNYQVLSQTDTVTVIEIRPLIQSVTLTQEAGSQVYRFAVKGDLVPTVKEQADGFVAVGMPGARMAQGVPASIGNLQIAAHSAGVGVWFRRAGAYTVKRGQGFVEIILQSQTLAGKRIVLDPGHGGEDAGAVYYGVAEKSANWNIAVKLQALLEAAGAQVIMTRSGDARCSTDYSGLSLAERARQDLVCRTEIANNQKADLFLSIHNNSGPAAARGTETYYSPYGMHLDASRRLANLIQGQVPAALGIPNRGVYSDFFYVITYTDAPSALVEVAYLSNPTDALLIGQAANQQKVAEALYRALDSYFRS